MGRQKLNKIRTHIAIDQETFAELETLLLDPEKGGLRYGALSAITNRLYRQWLETLRKPGVDPIAYLKAYGVDIGTEERT